MKIVACQLNPVVGDVQGNAARVCEILAGHAGQGIDLFVFPELYLQGYPPGDLLDKKWFIRNSLDAVDKICSCSQKHPGTGVLLGSVVPDSIPCGKGLSNAAVLICDGKVVFHQKKSLLPSYDVFDEPRYFDPAKSSSVFEFKGEKLGISICEDAWNDAELWPQLLYNRDPVAELAAEGATILINISASPFHAGKESLRQKVIRNHARKHRLPFIFVNQVGANDELIFDGSSLFIDADGNLRELLPSFDECVKLIDTDSPGPVLSLPEREEIASVHDALVLGVRDYVRKCGFTSVLLGLSGGIDSAVVAAIASRAVGPENVWGVTMPSRYSSDGSISDSEKLAGNLGIRFSTIPIEKAFSAFLDLLSPVFEGTAPGVAEENIQARIRGTLLMTISNKFGHLLLTTGNKSELSVGYCTLYGDMNGGLAVISDLPKAMVYKLADYINLKEEIIPASTLTKAPSAELRPNQKDQDTLPPYPVLDSILNLLIEEGKSSSEIAESGFDETTVKWIAKKVAASEYKRRQAPTGLKVSPRALGSGWRFPLAAFYEW
ncbi:MAG: NAD+ synthase [Fibrobacter sp.]|nr:NAD+ synthase [Fibrobacter sp.]